MITKIQYKTSNSFLWVSEEKPKGQCWIYNPKGSENNKIRFCDKALSIMILDQDDIKEIIAQTNVHPEIPNIPIIELPDEEDKLIEAKAIEYATIICHGRRFRLFHDGQDLFDYLVDCYKSSSKEKMFSEEQLDDAIKIAYYSGKYAKEVPYSEVRLKIIQSLTAKSNDNIIGCEIEMEYNEERIVDGKDIGDYSPITYQKEGKTFLEVKQFIYK